MEIAVGQVEQLWTRLETEGAEPVLKALGDLPADAPVVARTLRALALFEAGQFAEARQGFETVLKAEPQNPIASLYLVLCLYRLGNPRAAGKLLQEVVILPHRHWLREFLRTFWPERRAINAINLTNSTTIADPRQDDYRRWKEHADKIDPALLQPGSNALMELARLLASFTTERGNLHRSTRRLGEDYARRGTNVFHRGRLPEALFFFERAHQVLPHDAGITANLAYLYLLNQRPAEARELLQPMLQEQLDRSEQSGAPEDGVHPDALVCYAWCLHEEGQSEQALRVLSAVVPEGPDDWGAHFVAAVCWLDLQREAEYREALDMATGPYFIDTWEQLIRPFIVRTGDWLRAQPE